MKDSVSRGQETRVVRKTKESKTESLIIITPERILLRRNRRKSMNSGERKNRFNMRFAGKLAGLILSVLSLLLVFGCLTAFAAAGDTVMSGQDPKNSNVTWTLIDNGDETYTLDVAGSGVISSWFMHNDMSRIKIILGDYFELVTDIRIGKDITGIGEEAFHRRDNSFKTVTFEPGSKLTSIGEDAFYGNKELVTDLSGLTELSTIQRNAFSVCYALPSQDLSGLTKLTALGEYAFHLTKAMSSIVLPPNLATIPKGAFSSNGLTSITFPKAVKTIEDTAFYGCDNLKEILFEEGSSLTTISDSAFSSARALDHVDLSNAENLT